MKSTELRQLIRESINEYIREIDEAGNIAALEAKMNKTQEAIELREKKMNMDGLDEAYHDMLDKGKMKELGSEVKALKKSLAKYEKQLDKLRSKSEKKEKPELEEKEIVDEVTIDETFPESGAQLEEDSIEEARFKKGTDIGKKGKEFEKIAKSAAKRYGSEEAGKRVAGSILKKVLKKEEVNESFLYMQKLAGLITEGEYKKLTEGLKFSQVEKDRKYTATEDFGIFKKDDEVFVDTVRNLGTEVVLELSNNKGKKDSIKGDLGEEVEVFD